MNRETIPDDMYSKSIILFIMGSTLVMGTGGKAGRNTWISIILAMIFSIPVVLMYARILMSYPEKDLFDIIKIIFGKYFGRFLIILFSWFAFHLGVLVLRNFGEFMVTVALSQTPMILPIIIYAAICAYSVRGGLEPLGRFSRFFFIILIAALAFFDLLSIPLININNIRPVMGDGLYDILLGAFQAFAFPFGETVIFMMVFSSFKTQKSPCKIYLSSILIGGLVILIVTLRNYLVLGVEGVDITYFPSYTAVSRVNVHRFVIQRLESVVAVTFLITGFVKASYCLLATCKGIAKLFNINDHNFIVTPITILMAISSAVWYKNIMEMAEWAFEVWVYYAPIFQLFLPVIIYIRVKMKTRSQTI